MGYSKELYIHDMDREAFEALYAFPQFRYLKDSYIDSIDEKAAKINFLSGAIRLSENQMSEVYNLLPPICGKLEIDIPELYYINDDRIDAATGGYSNPYIFVTSGLVKALSPEMIASALAHECGHIACKHALYHSMALQFLQGVEKSPFFQRKETKKCLSPAMIKTLLFWDRCSELTADRAAVLCDGNADKTVDMILKVHGYDGVNREEFLKQAIDLHEFVEESDTNRMVEQMLTQDEDHPRMATRAYECYKWAESERFKGMISGTYTIENLHEEEKAALHEEEVIAAEMHVETSGENTKCIDIDAELERVNKELNRYTCQADAADYAFAVASGIFAGVLDAVYVGETTITSEGLGLSHKQVNQFIQEFARSKGIDNERLKDAISGLEDKYKVAQDNVWKGTIEGINPSNHHLADLAHHPTPIGLLSAIIVRFLRVGTFVNKNGEWHFQFVKTNLNDLVETIVPAVLTGILNWLVAISEKTYEEETDHEVPEAIHRLAHLVASTPILIEIAKCADNWFGHLVSDMGGSSSAKHGGMGIPGIFLSLLHEISALPILKDTEMPAVINDLYVNHKMDLRHEIALGKELGKQAIPVVFNELYVRLGYFVSRLCTEIADKGFKGIDWANVIPFRNRTIRRMITVASMTFTVADTADAAVHAALASGGEAVLFATNFVKRFNFVGAGRAAISIVNEISDEKREAQLIHEKMILTEVKTAFVIRDLEEYKAKLREQVATYLAEDIESFINGFDYMVDGLAAGDSNLVIKGNVIIQRVLGREPQFTNQSEFDALMDSDVALIL